MNKYIFREYDIRGLSQEDLTNEVAELLGRACGTYLGGGQVIVGRDNRLSSERISQALLGGLLSTGARVIDIGLTVSPLFYYSRILYGISGGVMVTASHNPSEYNGFKICRGEGTIYGKEIQKLRFLMEKGEFLKGKGRIETKDPQEEYKKVLKEKIQLARKLKVVVDCGNGTGSLLAEEILKNWGCEVVPLYCDSDGHFPHHLPDPAQAEYLQDLIARVKEEKADLGLGIDGDADRLGAVDEKGNIIWGDLLLVLFFRELLERQPGAKCIIEVKCSQALYDEVVRLGGQPIFYKTGHSLIKAKMREEGALVTGEMSGHMFFKDEYFGFDDAFYAAGRLLRILSQTPRKFSELFLDLPQYYSTPELRLEVPEEKKFKITKELVSYFKTKYPVIDIDGGRVIFPCGWGLIRASNTQAALIVRCEGQTKEALEEIKKIVFNQLKKYPEVSLKFL